MESPSPDLLLDRVEAEAIRQLYTQFTVLAKGKIRRTANNIKRRSGEFQQPFAPLGVATKYRGLLVDLRFSEYAELFVRRIKIRGANAATGNVYVYDVDTGELLGTHSITSVNGSVTTLTVDTSYFGSRIFICYDAQVLNLVETDGFSPYDILCDCGCGEGAYEIAPSVDIIYENLDSSQSVGMIVEYDVRCSPEAWLCKHSDLAVNALLYQMGVTMLNQTYLSNMVNYVTLQADDLNALREMYAEARDNALEQVYEAVGNDWCFECAAPVVNTYVLP